MTIPVPTEPAETELDRLLVPYVAACRNIVVATVAAAIDAAAEHGLDWDDDSVRNDVSEFVVRQVHAALVVHLRQNGADPETVADHSAPADDCHD